MQLSKHNNSEVLDAMKSMSEITGLDFERVCRTGLSTWWASIFDNTVSNGECESRDIPYNKNEHGMAERRGVSSLTISRHLSIDMLL